jgi:hypothetical protein
LTGKTIASVLALGVIGLTCLSVLLVDGVVAVLLWRRSDDWMALLAALTLVLLPTNFTPGLNALNGVWEVIAKVFNIAGVLCFLLLIGLFPSGRFVPRWLWLPTLVVTIAVQTVGPHLPPLFSLVPILGTVLGLIASQIYRYRRVSTPAQRQQTKWAVYGFVLALLVDQLFWQTAAGIPALHQPDSLYSLLVYPDSFLIIVILTAFFSLAILRSRLFDIDVIIRQTLIYGTLTAVLAALYASAVIGLPALVGSVNSAASHSPVLIVASTLLIAALFTPVRHSIQKVIDRRFYRVKYDATETLAAFGTTLRTETDLKALSEQLVNVVQETMQPAYVSLWLARPRQVPQQRADSPQHQEAHSSVS